MFLGRAGSTISSPDPRPARVRVMRRPASPEPHPAAEELDLQLDRFEHAVSE
jgi:hypothetical protein